MQHSEGKPCTQATHAAHQGSLKSFLQHTRFLGYQITFLNEPPPILGVCLDCRSTLARRLSPAEVTKLELQRGGQS